MAGVDIKDFELKKNLKSQEKRVFMKEWQRLKFQAANMEREFSATLSNRMEAENKTELIDEENDTKQILIREKNQVVQRLAKLHEKTNFFHKCLTLDRQTKDFVSTVQQAMLEVETTLNQLKQHEKDVFKKLLNNEHDIKTEIEMIEKRLKTILKSSTTSKSHQVKNGTKISQILKECNLPPEVVAFEKYLNMFGSTGGWDEADHSTYLRLKRRTKNKAALLVAAKGGLVGRTEEDISSHDHWYQQFVELKEAKKVAIEEWKIKKEKNMTVAVEKNGDNLKEIEEARKEKEAREMEAREIKKEEIEKWKRLKTEHAERVAEEEMRHKEKVKKMKEKEIERMSQVRIEARERMKMKKMEKERERCIFEMEQERIRSKRAEEAAQEIVRFRSRDRENLEIKLEEKRRKEEEEKIKQQRLDRLKQSVKVSVESDRNRLYRPTTSTTQRNKFKEDGIIQQNLVMKIPHRAVPSWRKGT